MNNLFNFKDPKYAQMIQGGANLSTVGGQMIAPDAYDSRIQATKPGLGQFANLQMTGIGSAFGPVGTGIGFAADMVKNGIAYNKAMDQYNIALSKNNYLGQNQNLPPDFTQMMRQGGSVDMGGGMPVLESNEIVLMPQPDGSWKKIMQTPSSAADHEQGGVAAPQLPAGAVVFPQQYMQQIEQALQRGDFQTISQMAQQVMQESQQAKEQGQPYSSGGGGQLPQAQQQQVQDPAMAQQQMMPTEQMPFQGMRCGGMVKHYGNGGMIKPDMMQSDDYTTQKERFEATQQGLAQDAANTQMYQKERENEADMYFQNPQNKPQNQMASENINAPVDLQQETKIPIYDKNGNITSFQNENAGIDQNYYSQSNKDKRNADWARRGKTNPDANDSKSTNSQPKATAKATAKATQSNTSMPNDAQDRTVTRQQAMKAGVYENSYWDDKEKKRYVTVGGKREVFDPNKSYGKSKPITYEMDNREKAAAKKVTYTAQGPETVKPNTNNWENPLNTAAKSGGKDFQLKKKSVNTDNSKAVASQDNNFKKDYIYSVLNSQTDLRSVYGVFDSLPQKEKLTLSADGKRWSYNGKDQGSVETFIQLAEKRKKEENQRKEVGQKIFDKFLK